MPLKNLKKSRFPSSGRYSWPLYTIMSVIGQSVHCTIFEHFLKFVAALNSNLKQQEPGDVAQGLRGGEGEGLHPGDGRHRGGQGSRRAGRRADPNAVRSEDKTSQGRSITLLP